MWQASRASARGRRAWRSTRCLPWSGWSPAIRWATSLLLQPSPGLATTVALCPNTARRCLSAVSSRGGSCSWIQARAHEAERHWDAAAAVCTKRWCRRRPEDEDLQLALAKALALGDHCLAARATLAKLRQAVVRRTQGSWSDVQISLAEAETAGHCRDWQGEKAAAQHSVQQAQRLGRSADLAAAQQHLAEALNETGDIKNGEILLLKVLSYAEQSGNLELQFRAGRGLAASSRDRGDFDETERRLAGLVDLARRMRDPSDEGLAQRSLGALYVRKGRLDEAVAAHRRALTLFSSTEEHSLAALSLNSLGLIAEMRNDFSGALRFYDQALPLLRTASDAQGLGAVLGGTPGAFAGGSARRRQRTAELAEASRLLESHHDVHAIETLTNLTSL